MLPTLCGHLALLAALSADPLDLPPPQVTSPRLRPTQQVIPEVTSAPAPRGHTAPGLPSTFRFVPPLDPAALGQRGGETNSLTVTPEPGTARPEATHTEEPPVRPEDSRAHEEPGLLVRLVLSGQLRQGGVTVAWWKGTREPIAEAQLFVEERTLYLAETLAVVAMTLELSPAATKPWAPGEAWLLDARGDVVGRFPVWMEGTRLGPGEKRTVAFEVERVPGTAPQKLRLELRERDGGHTVQAGDLKL
ncbi:uncharacterized protein DUF2381 [Archangium gephyra]|uniref:Uncharacterized protein DUF2381 n=1 Tax=Archangium gephyra TaxID=48 RepID=A0AAC8QHN8_9BACT|nr:DUF2381 family protein [Archangium gephyra]AKJ07236.1 Hypothetical protein AA314_08862 [Archangium gephyra]REG26644.1 uncharacterized protein DUF2381 [Archangium gephyra]